MVAARHREDVEGEKNRKGGSRTQIRLQAAAPVRPDSEGESKVTRGTLESYFNVDSGARRSEDLEGQPSGEDQGGSGQTDVPASSDGRFVPL